MTGNLEVWLGKHWVTVGEASTVVSGLKSQCSQADLTKFFFERCQIQSWW
jgi:hypothetical protein